jgi:exopolysaccharide production protein ExoY
MVLLSPMFAAIFVVALVTQGRPVLFSQKRVGLAGREFEMFKFRTMEPNAEERTRSYADGVVGGIHGVASAVSELKNGARSHVTPLGAVLRKTSLDELPQLWNVWRGDMSLVGPRPLRKFEHDALDPWAAVERTRMRPGITGLWQVRGRDEIHWNERVNLDQAQVRNWRLVQDMKILVETIPAMLRGR